MNRWLPGSIVAVVSTLLAADAGAHISLTFPAVRDIGLKAGPCGTLNSVRGSNVTTFKPGEKITVTWTETIDHPGHYRVSFDDDGNDSFVDPKAYDDFYTAPSVLLDNIADKTGSMQMYAQVITLPNKECTNCTLQVLQVMTDKPPFGDGNEFYYQCADIVISAGGAGSSSAASSSSGSGSTGAGSGGGGGAGGTGFGGGEDGGGCSCRTGEEGGGSFSALALLGLAWLLKVRRAQSSSGG